MVDEIMEKIDKLNSSVIDFKGKITGANYRIELYEKELNELNKELEELKNFKNTVNNDYDKFVLALQLKRKYVNQANSIKNVKCAKEYYNAMYDRLTGIRPTTTHVLFGAIISALQIKIDSHESRIGVLTGLISSEKILIGDLNGAINSTKKQISKLMEDQ